MGAPDVDRALATAFVRHLDRPENFADLEALEEALRALLDAARAACPGVELPDEEFAAYLGARAPADLGQLGRVHAGDLYLACACGGQNREALARFDQILAQQVGAVVARTGETRTFADELRQVLRHRLLVADEGAPKLATYQGQGALAGWIGVVAMRAALRQLRKGQREVELADDDLLALPAVAPDPALDLLRGRYQKEFASAFTEALSNLSSRERNVLRLHLVHGVGLARICSIYRVHRSTVLRWIARARDKVIEDTRRLLCDRLHVPTSEFDSLVAVLRSQLDVSIVKFLGETAPDRG